MKTATKKTRASQTSTVRSDPSELLQRYGCGPIQFSGTDNALYERHLIFDNVIDAAAADPRERFEAFARSVRDILSQRWVQTEKTYERENPKRVYYLSMEYLIGRSLANNVTNLLLDPLVKRTIKEKNLDWLEFLDPGIFAPLLNLLLKDGDYYRRLADLTSYLKADQQLCELYADHAGWARTATLNVASSGKFSSDRAITQYATDIWRAVPCPVS